MESKIYRGCFGCLYKVADARVYASVDGGKTWVAHVMDLDFFQDGIDKGYLVEVKKDA